MKMFRLFAGITALLMLGLAGCGTESPDFTPKLSSIAISASASSVPNGDTLQFIPTVMCTTPPGYTENGTPKAEKECSISNLQWAVLPISGSAGAGTISDSGLLKGTSEGDINVVASADGISSDPVKITVGPAAIKTLVVTPQDQSVGQEGTVDYLVKATYSNDPGNVVLVKDADTIEWAAYNVGTTTPSSLVTLDPTDETTTTATAHTTAGQVTITACSPSCSATSKVTGTSTLTVTTQTLTGLSSTLEADPVTATVPEGQGQSVIYKVKGTYNDGTSSYISNASLDWTVDDATIGKETPADPVGNSYSVEGIKKGSTQVHAALKTGTYPSITGAKRTSSGPFSVTDAYCTKPLAQPTATTATSKDALCLLCSVDQPDNAIDASQSNYASLVSTAGLLLSNVTLTVNSNVAAVTPPPGGQTVGFTIQVPPGALLSAEVLLSQYTVSTLLSGNVQQSFKSDAASTLPPLLDLTLLGTIGGKQIGLVKGVATQPFDALSISFGTGVASLLTTTRVYSACASIDTTKLPTP